MSYTGFMRWHRRLGSLAVILLIIVGTAAAALRHSSVVSAQAAPKKPLRVFAYNIGGPERTSIAMSKNELEQLAQFIIANQVDIALLAEVNNYATRKNAPPDDIDEGPYLQQYLQSRGYQMQLVYTPMTGTNGRKLFGQVILTRYAAVPNSFLDQPYPGDDTRWIPSVQVLSPLGTLRVAAIHTQYGSGTCRQLLYLDQYLQSLRPTNSRLLAGGDFNTTACGDGWSSMMKNYQSLCGQRLDHLITPKQNDFAVAACQMVDPKVSDHPAVMADLLLKNGLAYPNPLPTVLGTTPSPSTAPAPVVGDLNGDRVVTRADVTLLVAKLGTEHCAYNLTGSCLIDLYDYNHLVQLVTRLD